MSCAARFYAARGFEQIAHLYLRNARTRYLRWGADGKVRQLDELSSAPAGGRASARPDEHDRGAGRTSRPRDGDQGVASRLGRDRSRKADRHADAHRDRAGGAERGLLILFARGRAADRGGSHDRRRHGDRAPARRARDRGRAAGIGSPLRPAHAGERDSRRCRGPVLVCGGSIHPSAPGPFHSLPAADQPGQTHRRALSREQPGSSRLRAGPHRGAEAARLAGRDLAREQPLVPRSRGTRSEDPAPGRRQHHRDLHLGPRRSDSRGQ